MAFWNDPLILTLLGIAGVLIGNFMISRYMEARKKPKFVIETLQREDKLGFSVSVKRGLVKDAKVQCNSIDCHWENGDNVTERKDLYAGDDPSSFFPFQVNLEYKKDLEKFFKEAGALFLEKENEIKFLQKLLLQTENKRLEKRLQKLLLQTENKKEEFILDGVNVIIKEIKTNRVSSYIIIFPKGVDMIGSFFLYPFYPKEPLEVPLLEEISIRIIGAGIDEITDFSNYCIELSNMNLAAIRAGSPPPKDIIPFVFHLKHLKKKNGFFVR